MIDEQQRIKESPRARVKAVDDAGHSGADVRALHDDAQATRTEEGEVLEVIVYTLKPGVTHKAFVAAYDELSAWISRRPGFVSRAALRGTADDKWIELVYWDDLESAETVATESVSAPECLPFFQVVDMDSAQLLYGKPALPLVGAKR